MEPKEPLQTNAWSSAARTILMLAVLVGLALGIRATRSITAPILLGLVVVIGASPLVGVADQETRAIRISRTSSPFSSSWS